MHRCRPRQGTRSRVGVGWCGSCAHTCSKTARLQPAALPPRYLAERRCRSHGPSASGPSPMPSTPGPGESRVRDTPAGNSTGRGGMDSDVQARIDGLEAELQRLRAEVVAARADEQTSRREVFKKLAVAGAGAAVGAVALG